MHVLKIKLAFNNFIEMLVMSDDLCVNVYRHVKSKGKRSNNFSNSFPY